MIISNPRQYETLYNLVEGNNKPVDGRSVNALRRRGLVNCYGHATTRGWNALGRFRFVPEVDIPRDTDIETYRGTCIGVIELRDNNTEVLAGIPQFSPYECYIDSYILLKWYRRVKLKEQEFIESSWSEGDDNLWGSNAMPKDYMYMLLREATAYGLDNDHNIYTKHIFYEMATKLSTHLLPSEGRQNNRSFTSLKYSLQDNTDEVERFQWNAARPHHGQLLDSMKFIWVVNVD